MAERHGWRDQYPPHPCSDVFPMLTDGERAELVKDLRQHGLREPVTLWNDGTQRYVLEGRNRLEALKRAGVELTSDHFREYTAESLPDPAAFVVSKNIHRRHLTKKQQAQLIVKALKAQENDSANVARSYSPKRGNEAARRRTPSRKG